MKLPLDPAKECGYDVTEGELAFYALKAQAEKSETLRLQSRGV